MTLEDLLDCLRRDILNDRSDRVSGSSDYLWTDTTLVRYINEAQRRFAVGTYMLRDARTPECTRVTLVEGQTSYDLHPAVLAVLSAKISTAQADLQRVGHAALAAYRAPDSTFIDTSSYQGLPPGRTVAYSTDEELTYDDYDSVSTPVLRVYPEPDADAAGTIIQLRVVRKPLEPLTATNLQARPEIPEDHHLEMLDWAAYLALRIVDADAGTPARAAEFKASFEEHVKAARTVVLRKLFAPTGWGHGKGGWSWGTDYGIG